MLFDRAGRRGVGRRILSVAVVVAGLGALSAAGPVATAQAIGIVNPITPIGPDLDITPGGILTPIVEEEVPATPTPDPGGAASTPADTPTGGADPGATAVPAPSDTPEDGPGGTAQPEDSPTADPGSTPPDTPTATGTAAGTATATATSPPPTATDTIGVPMGTATATATSTVPASTSTSTVTASATSTIPPPATATDTIGVPMGTATATSTVPASTSTVTATPSVTPPATSTTTSTPSIPPMSSATPTHTPTLAPPSLDAPAAGHRRVQGRAQPGSALGCITICLDTDTALTEPPCSPGDARLGVGGVDAAGRLVDASGAPGIPLANALNAGDCVYALDSCTMMRSASICVPAVGPPAPAPALSPAGALAALGGLIAVAFAAFRRQSSVSV
jgi:hypothetical protein